MSLCKDCISGVRHEGTPEGKFETIEGVEVYVATPTMDYPKDKAVLILPDVFGIRLINTQLLADDFARNGFQVYSIDYLNKDTVPVEAMQKVQQGTFDLSKWFPNHGEAQTRPPLDKVINALKQRGIKEFGATGYCFGGRYGFDLAYDGVIKVLAVAHPSLLKFPDDLEKYSKTNVPILMNSCTNDSQFPHEAQEKADNILGGGKFAPGYKRNYYEGCTHGFAVRGDLSDPKVKAGKEGSFKETVEWFIKYL
jgi:dienelactone hydrolase